MELIIKEDNAYASKVSLTQSDQDSPIASSSISRRKTPLHKRSFLFEACENIKSSSAYASNVRLRQSPTVHVDLYILA